MDTTAAPTTCTVITGGLTHTRCGKPAVTTFTGLGGTTYAECAEHAPPGAAAPTPAVTLGTRVEVTHIGIPKVGTVVKVGRKLATIEVPIHAGTPKARLVAITRPLVELKPLV